jgi:hypothetical protein
MRVFRKEMRTMSDEKAKDKAAKSEPNSAQPGSDDTSK